MDHLVYFSKTLLLPVSLFITGRLLIRLLIKDSVRGIRGLLEITLFFAAIRLGLYQTDIPTSRLGIQISQGLLLFFLAFTGIRVFEVIFFERGPLSRQRVPMLFRDILRFILLIVVFLVLLKITFKVDLSALVVTSTVMSAILGLALQDMLSNIVAGVALQIEHPFKVGHWVRVGTREGMIVGMSWRSTSLRTRDADVVLIPNSILAKSEILNFHVPDKLHMTRQNIATSYNDPPGKVKEALIRAMSYAEGVCKDPAPEVFLLKYDDFMILYEMRFWISDFEFEPRIRDRVMERLWYVFQREGITIPYPVRNVILEDKAQMLARRAHEQSQWEDHAVSLMRQGELMMHFSSETLSVLASEGQFCYYGNDEFLVHQNDHDSSFFIITSGTVSVSVQTGELEPTLIGTFGVGYFFGETALLTGSPRTASVKAIGHVEALVIGKDAVSKAMKLYPEMVEALSQILKQRNEDLTRRIKGETVSTEATKREEEVSMLQWVQRFFNL